MAVTTAPQPPPPADYNGGRPMTILEHLLELRMRLIWCALSLVIGVLISVFFTNQFLRFLIDPVREYAPEAELILNDPLENFAVYFRVSLLGGLIIAMPMIVYQTLLFVLPGLTPSEKRWVIPIVFGIFVSFLLGAAFSYYITLPRAVDFLLGFNTDIAQPYINIGKYINFSTRLIFWVGVTFEAPLFILALARFGIVTGRRLLGWWRYMIVVTFLIAAVVTPTPDPVTQTMVAGPLLALYLVGVLLAFLFGTDRKRPGAPDTGAA